MYFDILVFINIIYLFILCHASHLWIQTTQLPVTPWDTQQGILRWFHLELFAFTAKIDKVTILCLIVTEYRLRHREMQYMVSFIHSTILQTVSTNLVMMTSCLTGSGDCGWMDRLLVECAHTSSQLVSMMVWLLAGEHRRHKEEEDTGEWSLEGITGVQNR